MIYGFAKDDDGYEIEPGVPHNDSSTGETNTGLSSSEN